ncbi:uncharacterized protein BJX67DRAFT_385268 [Aspergillus lucknowensis]|uniref:Uncharacterized protein n=1 Tax=Aspergillus lucknowensis TaxID=176173 RepID=A0ABR4LE34_9EURO
MAASPKPYTSFTISSSCLCFGSLHNIWHGACIPPQQGFPNVRPRLSGTVLKHSIEYNLPAKNGKWNAFQLLDHEKNVTAWFIAHSDVDPEKEVDKILRVSGFRNNAKKAAAGILVINRYDWDYYDERSWDEIHADGEEDGVDELEGGSTETATWCGIVDYTEAKTNVLQWKEQQPSERTSSEGGISLYLCPAEYMHGRFGFDEDNEAARSFLFFSGMTEFKCTTFVGLQQTLKKEETPKETLERWLREGADLSGLRSIRLESLKLDPLPPRMKNSGPGLPPLASECLGPYDKSEHILRAQDIEALRLGTALREPVIQEFVESWRERSFDLINDMVMSYLERTVLPSVGNRTVSAAADVLFPRHHVENSFDRNAYCFFTRPHARYADNPGADFDSAFVSGKIRTFLASRTGGSSVVFDNECILGICNVVAYMLEEVFELANNHSRDCRRPKILPWDIRIAVFNDPELLDLLKFSKVYWEGRGELPLPETREESYVTLETMLAMQADWEWSEYS